MSQKKYLDLDTAAEYLGISKKTVRTRVADGSLPAYRMGPRCIRIRLEDIDALLVRIPNAKTTA